MINYHKKIIEYQRLTKELSRGLPKIEEKTFKNETVYLDFNHYLFCEFYNCRIIVEYGISRLIDCHFQECNFVIPQGSPASLVVTLERRIKNSDAHSGKERSWL